MEVNGVNLKQIFNVYMNNKARPERSADNSDKLEIGHFYKDVEDAKEVKLPPDPKTEEIKMALKNHTYNVSTETVSQKMMTDVLISMNSKKDGAR